MSTTAISNACIAGAMGGLLAGRFLGSIVPGDYAAIANAAAAIGAEFITENTASGAAMADADNANITSVIASVTKAAIEGGGYSSITPADYLPIAKQIYAASKQALTKLA